MLFPIISFSKYTTISVMLFCGGVLPTIDLKQASKDRCFIMRKDHLCQNFIFLCNIKKPSLFFSTIPLCVYVLKNRKPT